MCGPHLRELTKMMKRLKKKSEKSGLIIVVAKFGVVEGVLAAQILNCPVSHI